MPFAYYLVTKWLEDFPYKIAISISLFFQVFIIVFGLAIVTIGWQTLKAAQTNPVNSLKYE